MTDLTIKGTDIHAVSPEGESASMPLDAFIEKLAGRPADSRSSILPDGVKSVVSRGAMEIWIHQSPPQAWSFKWIAEDSPVQFGKGTEYRMVRIALPYVITCALFIPGKDGKLTLSGHNEIFFAERSLAGWDVEMNFPALLNCSKFDPQEGKPLAWICTQYLNRAFDAEKDPSRRQRLAFGELMHCLLETGFNYSSEHHEASSWYSESKTVDPRIASVEAWEKATAEDELFALDVPWKKTGMNLGQIVDRMFTINQANQRNLGNANALARLVFNHQRREKVKEKIKQTSPELPTASPFAPPAASPFPQPFETLDDSPF